MQKPGELKVGWIKKKKSQLALWKSRFAVFSEEGEIHYYKDEHRKKHKGKVNLSDTSSFQRQDDQTIKIEASDCSFYLWCFVSSQSNEWENALIKFLSKSKLNKEINSHIHPLPDKPLSMYFQLPSQIPSAPSFDEMKSNNINNSQEHKNVPEKLSFKAYNNLWLSYNKGSLLNSSSTILGPNERFTVKCVVPSNQLYTIQSFDNKYLCCSKNGNVVFVELYNGIFEQWKINFYPVNSLSIQSTFGNYLNFDETNKIWCCKNNCVDQLSLLEPSPPILSLHKDIHNDEVIVKIPWPSLPKTISLRTMNGRGNWLGVENNNVKCNGKNLGGFDGKAYASQIFKVIKDAENNLYAFEAFNNKYLSCELDSNKIILSNALSDREYFQVIWISIGVIALRTCDNKYIKCDDSNSNYLLSDSIHWNSLDSLFLIEPKAVCPINRIPSPKLNLVIRLKGNNNKYVKFQFSPDHLEASSTIIGEWEQIFVKPIHIDSGGYYCYLLTNHGKYIATFPDGVLKFLDKDEGNYCKWEIYFHDRQYISIKSFDHGCWLRLNLINNYLIADQRPKYTGFKLPLSKFAMLPFATI